MSASDLRKQVDKLGVPKVAEESGVPKTTIRSWLRNGDQSMGQARHAAVVKAVQKLLAQMSEESDVKSDEDYVDVPSYEIRAAAGAGAFADENLPVVYEKFRLGFLERLASGPLVNLSLITVSGDSMEDSLRPGDQILVDRSITRWAGDGIYILQFDGVLQCKRLQRDSDGSLMIRSDNPRYETIRPKKGIPMEVIGRVVWQSRSLV